MTEKELRRRCAAVRQTIAILEHEERRCQAVGVPLSLAYTRHELTRELNDAAKQIGPDKEEG